MSAGARLWLIRHAPVQGPPGVIHGPDAPADLSDAATAEALRAQLPRDARVVVSASRRTRETARRLVGDQFQVEPYFQEQDFGAWTGKRHDDLLKEANEAYRRFWSRPGEEKPPGGESFADQIKRCREGLLRLGLDRAASDIVVVAHSGTIRAMLAIALRLEPDAALAFMIDPWSLTRIDRIAGDWRVNFVNWTPRSVKPEGPRAADPQ